MSSTPVFIKGHFRIYKTDKPDWFIVRNESKPFKFGHTHICGYSNAIRVAIAAATQKIPRHCSGYELVSILRICRDSKFKRNVKSAVTAYYNKKKRDEEDGRKDDRRD